MIKGQLEVSITKDVQQTDENSQVTTPTALNRAVLNANIFS